MTYKDQLSKVYSEIEIMKHLRESGGGHPNIVELHEVMDDEEKDKLYMGKLRLNSKVYSSWLLWERGVVEVGLADVEIQV